MCVCVCCICPVVCAVSRYTFILILLLFLFLRDLFSAWAIIQIRRVVQRALRCKINSICVHRIRPDFLYLLLCPQHIIYYNIFILYNVCSSVYLRACTTTDFFLSQAHCIIIWTTACIISAGDYFSCKFLFYFILVYTNR